MSAQPILTRKENRIGFITLNRPEQMNTFTPEFAEQLDAALWAMEKDDEVKVVIINANGKHFCTGIQLDQFNNKTHTEYRKFLYGIDAFYHTIAKMTKTTIAAVHGYTLANGAGLAFAADLTIATESTTFGTTAINVGLICLGPAAPMSKVIGRKKLIEMVLTGDMFGAAEAEKLGLINQVVADDQLDAAALDLAKKLVKKSSVALRIGKEGLNRLYEDAYDRKLDIMDDMFAAICAGDEAEEGVKAFIEKRKPSWYQE
ncbi:short chain enoyl-CoA hydratase [Malonomonas rubra DSM 5091]|uniref:Short chain enoyl-CoA hydratase n=1 Tax=Malonomonas rubra DSM 5091 TaxID=1122189 RepID=A0A1M6FA56_MALRU|nr:enoyl-CoA hydratase-related protein [Malonomonas rubra]SHI94536.1 short chain enoyl-CoA hydratase [Malonomonas rubra DSM 5091]